MNANFINDYQLRLRGTLIDSIDLERDLMVYLNYNCFRDNRYFER